MANRKEILTIEIDSDEAINNIREAKRQVAELKREQNELKKSERELIKEQKKLRDSNQQGTEAYRENERALNEVREAMVTDEYIENEAQIRELNKEIRNNNKILDESQNKNKAAEGSLVQMREQLKLMTREYENMSEEQRDNTEEGRKMQENILKTTEDLKAKESAIGDNRRNVGNYSGALQEATSNLNIMGVNVGGVTRNLGNKRKALMGATGALKGTTKGLKLFRLALIATGIGAIVVAIGTLIAAYSSMQEGMDDVNKVMKPLNEMFKETWGILQDLGKGLMQIFKGNFSEGFDQMADAVSNVGERLGNAANRGRRLAEIIIELEELELSRLKQMPAMEKAYEEQITKMNDVTLSEQERADAIEEAERLQRQMTKLKAEEIELQIEQMELELEANDTSRKEMIELQKLKNQLVEIETQEEKKLQQVRRRAAAITKRQQDEEIRRIEEMKRAEEERQQEKIAAIQREIDAANDARRKEFQELQRIKAAEISLIRETAEENSRAILEAAELTIEQEREKRLKALEEELQDRLANAELTEEEKLRITEDFERVASVERQAIEQETLAQLRNLRHEFELEQLNRERNMIKMQSDERVAELEVAYLREEIEHEEFLQRKMELEQEFVQARLELMRDEMETLSEESEEFAKLQHNIKMLELQQFKDAEQVKRDEIERTRQIQEAMGMSALGTASMIGDAFSQAFKEGSKEAKAFALLQIKADTAAAAIAAYKANIGFPPPVGPILAAAGVAAAITQGGVRAAEVMKLSKGGYNIEGQGNGTSDNIPAMLSRGESVMTAKETSMFGSEIMAIKKAAGKRRYATGAFNLGSENRQIGRESVSLAKQRNDLKTMFESMPSPVVAVTDINRGQRNTAKIVQRANV